MITQADLDRINELSRLARERELTDAEQQERQTLRARYVEAFRESLTAQLDHTSIRYPDGTVKKLKRTDR